MISNSTEETLQKKKANELRDELLKNGFFVNQPNTSITNFGISTYIGFYDEFDVYRKFRISDHSVTNTHRIWNEYHYNQNSDVSKIVEQVKKDIEETKQDVSIKTDLHNKDRERTKLANEKWERVKDKFKDLCFKTNSRTYQDLSKFSENKNRTNIYQKALDNNRYGETPYYYEWTEPKNQNEYCTERPSREYIENFITEELVEQKENKEMTKEEIKKGDRVFDKKKNLYGTIVKKHKPQKGTINENELFLIDIKYDGQKVIGAINMPVGDRFFLADESELEKGVNTETEHLETLDKVATGEITPEEGVLETAETHIAEDPKYYDKLEEMENKNTEFEGSSKGTGALYEFFTPDEVVKKMWQLAYDNGFTKGSILEPALGSGRLLKYAPKGCSLTAFEINRDNFDVASKLLSKYFDNVDLHNDRFETAFLEPPRFNSRLKKKDTWLKNYPFDLVIANPPYGEFTGLYKTHFKFSGQFEHWFIEYTMKLVKSGGLGVFLVPSSFMRNGISYNGVKERIFADSKLIDAYRLPANIFKKTQIGTDIIILKKK